MGESLLVEISYLDLILIFAKKTKIMIKVDTMTQGGRKETWYFRSYSVC